MCCFEFRFSWRCNLPPQPQNFTVLSFLSKYTSCLPRGPHAILHVQRALQFSRRHVFVARSAEFVCSRHWYFPCSPLNLLMLNYTQRLSRFDTKPIDIKLLLGASGWHTRKQKQCLHLKERVSKWIKPNIWIRAAIFGRHSSHVSEICVSWAHKKWGTQGRGTLPRKPCPTRHSLEHEIKARSIKNNFPWSFMLIQCHCCHTS